MTTVPFALERAGVPPGDVSDREKLRSIWKIDGWLQPSKKLDQLLTQLPATGVSGIPLNPLIEQLDPGELRFRYRASLLRVY